MFEITGKTKVVSQAWRAAYKCQCTSIYEKLRLGFRGFPILPPETCPSCGESKENFIDGAVLVYTIKTKKLFGWEESVKYSVFREYSKKRKGIK